MLKATDGGLINGLSLDQIGDGLFYAWQTCVGPHTDGVSLLKKYVVGSHSKGHLSNLDETIGFRVILKNRSPLHFRWTGDQTDESIPGRACQLHPCIRSSSDVSEEYLVIV